jgi:hypothetical protein
VELIKTLQDGPPMIVITWPNHKTEVSPAAFGDVMDQACRVLTNASTELAPSHRARAIMINNRIQTDLVPVSASIMIN